MIELEFTNVEGGKLEKYPQSKEDGINNKLNSHMTQSPGIEPEMTLVRGERLAATPPMLPKCVFPSTPLSLSFYVLSF
jgi:hypothetical protein